jgi:uncharacterized protein YicC (UPF0701 family)
MVKRTTILAILFVTSTGAAASEALKYVGAYECQATAINEETVKACAILEPQMATRASEAFAKWLARNSAKAEAAAVACTAQMQMLSETAANKEEVDYLRKQLVDLRREIIDSFRDRISREGSSVCEDALRQLENGTGAMDFK